MNTWTERARCEILKTGPTSTDKTDETHISSVSSVPTRPPFEKQHPVSSVSSVGVVAIFENCALADELLKAALLACDHWGDSEAARQQMRQDVEATPPHLQGDLLDHFRQTYPDKDQS